VRYHRTKGIGPGLLAHVLKQLDITRDPPGARAYYADHGDPTAPWAKEVSR
jgi:hypothetical protein